MENIFGIDSTIIDSVLKKGMMILKNGEFVKAPGTISLIYHPQLQRYVFVFGTNAQDASLVLLEDMDKLWKIL